MIDSEILDNLRVKYERRLPQEFLGPSKAGKGDENFWSFIEFQLMIKMTEILIDLSNQFD